MNKRAALIVIDVQRAFFEQADKPADDTAVIARINQLSAGARNAGCPVIFIHHERPETGLEYGSEAWQLHKDLKATSDDHLIRKTTPDSFNGTELDNLLKRLEVSELVICGFASEFCVDTTTRRAASLGYPVSLVGDAHTTYDKEHCSAAVIRQHHNLTLSSIQSFPAKVSLTTTADFSW